jgi:parallel beta-helix repeat protein
MIRIGFVLASLLSFLFSVATSPLSIKDSSQNGKVFEGLSIDANGAEYCVRVEGASDLTFKNCFFTNCKESGIMLKNTSGIKIDRCTFAYTGKRGVQLSSTGGNQNTLIQNCEIYGATWDGIYSGDIKGSEIQQPGLVIKNNWIHHVSSSTDWAGHYHGMYLQAPDAVVEGNLVTDVYDGNGISMRSSGIVRGNRILRVGKAGIAYFNDHPSGRSLELVIENNLVWAVNLNPALNFISYPIYLIDPPKDAKPPRVEKFSGKNNKIAKISKAGLSDKWPSSAFSELEVLAVLEKSPDETDPTK